MPHKTHREAGGERLRKRAGLRVGAGAGHAHKPGVRVGDAEAGGRGGCRRGASAEKGSKHLVCRGACFRELCRERETATTAEIQTGIPSIYEGLQRKML